MLIGSYNHTLDLKGRVSMPSKYRDVLGTEFFVTKGPDKCLYVYPSDKWETLKSKVEALPLSQRDIKHFFLGSAFTVEIDKQGRILLPQKLREYAALEKDVTVVGMSDHVELWDSSRWFSEEEKNESNIEDMLVSIDL